MPGPLFVLPRTAAALKSYLAWCYCFKLVFFDHIALDKTIAARRRLPLDLSSDFADVHAMR